MNGPAVCSNCHATRNPDMTIREGMEFAGGFRLIDPAFEVVAANITPDPETGIGAWTDAQIKAALTEGRTPSGGHVSPFMPVPWFRNVTPEDLDAIIAYLRTIPPVVNCVERTDFQNKAYP